MRVVTCTGKPNITPYILLRLWYAGIDQVISFVLVNSRTLLPVG